MYIYVNSVLLMLADCSGLGREVKTLAGQRALQLSLVKSAQNTKLQQIFRRLYGVHRVSSRFLGVVDPSF